MTRDEFFAQSIIQQAQRVTDLSEVFVITTPHGPTSLELPRYYSRTVESIDNAKIAILDAVQASWEAYQESHPFDQEGV